MKPVPVYLIVAYLVYSALFLLAQLQWGKIDKISHHNNNSTSLGL